VKQHLQASDKRQGEQVYGREVVLLHLQLLTQAEALPRRRRRRGERLGGAAGEAAQGSVQRRGRRLVGRRARRRPEGLRLHRHLPSEAPRRLAAKYL
jgi:hypothetical protein